MNKHLDKAIKIILAAMFLVCLLEMPYLYFQFVRIIGMTSFAIFAYLDWKKKNNVFMIIWICSALIINPFIKVDLGRDLWNVVDVIWAVIIFLSIILDLRIKDKENILSSKF